VSELPPGWTRTTLGQLGRYLNGRAFKKSEWSRSGRPIVRIQNLTGSSAVFNYFDGPLEERYIARPGDLLVSWAATLGAYIWKGPEAAVNQHIFRVESNIDKRFHKYLIDHALDELSRHTHGSGIVHITRGRFDAVPVLLPPLDEQHRIVAVLEDHLSRLDAASRYLQTSERLAALRRAALRDGLRAVSCGVPTVALADVADTALGKMLDASQTAGSPTPYLRNINVRWGQVDVCDLATVPLTQAERERFALAAGDLLVCEGGEPGRCAVWTAPREGVAYQKALHRVRPRSDVSSSFLALVVEAFATSEAGARQFTGTTIKHLPQERLRQIPVPLATPSDQAQLVADMADLARHTARLEAATSRGFARGLVLRQQLLAAASSGQL
jgi:type I restriction enzyme, S subunit